MNCSPNCCRTIVNENKPRDFRNSSVFIDRCANFVVFYLYVQTRNAPSSNEKNNCSRQRTPSIRTRERSHTVPVSFCSAGTDKCQLVKSNFLLVTVSRKSDVRYQERYLPRLDSRFLDRTYWKSLICEKNTIFQTRLPTNFLQNQLVTVCKRLLERIRNDDWRSNWNK